MCVCVCVCVCVCERETDCVCAHARALLLVATLCFSVDGFRLTIINHACVRFSRVHFYTTQTILRLLVFEFSLSKLVHNTIQFFS